MRFTCLIPLAVTGAAVAFIVVACGGSDGRACRVGADCASGMCGGDGKCLPPNGAGPGPGSSGDAGSGADTGSPSSPDAAPPPLGDGGCTPRHNGTITQDEVPLAPGLYAKFRVATNETISTAGTTNPDGTRAWDYSGALASDTDVLVETSPLTGKWYAGDFSGASYATTLSVSSALMGVFQIAPNAITLNGVVSPDQGVTQTELTNNPSVVVLQFPVKMGATWKTDTTVSGTAQGVLANYTESYDSEVDAAGTLKTPLGTFDVLRVKTTLTRTVGLVVTTIRSFAFVTECYGTVATVSSADNEQTVEFTNAAELRRIAP